MAACHPTLTKAAVTADNDLQRFNFYFTLDIILDKTNTENSFTKFSHPPTSIFNLKYENAPSLPYIHLEQRIVSIEDVWMVKNIINFGLSKVKVFGQCIPFLSETEGLQRDEKRKRFSSVLLKTS